MPNNRIADFVISNSGNIYFLEGNIGPGITWDTTDLIDTQKAQQLIRSIVQVMAKRVVATKPETVLY